MPWIRVLGGIAVLVLAACNDNDLPSARRDIGYISVEAPVSGRTNATASALFFNDATGLPLPNSKTLLDSCEIRPFVAGTSLLTPGAVTYLAAGDTITMQTDNALGFLTPDTLPDGTPTYSLTTGGGLPFTPGTVVTFAIPGAPDAFSAGTATGLMPEPYELGPIDTMPEANAGLPITWSPAGDDSSHITLSLQYASVGSSVLDQQLFCSLRDDGVDTIPARLLHEWRSSSGPRHVDSFRWRSAIEGTRTVVLDVVTKYNVSPPLP
jgi:hypothetical protein